MLTTTATAAPRVAIVVPCFNESQRLNASAFEEFVQCAPDVRFLFVNDGSTDNTLDLLDRLCSRNPEQFTLLDLAQNQGKAEAVRRGMLAAFEGGAELAGFWDADLATPLAAIPEFIAPFDDAPELNMVLGSRVRLLGRQIERRPLRHYLGRIFATAVSLVLGLPVYDTQCGAKLFRNSPGVRELFAAPFHSRWIFDVELLARWIRLNRRETADRQILELPLREWRDVPGSKLKSRDFVRAAWELRQIRRVYLRRRTAPSVPPVAVREGAPPDPAILTPGGLLFKVETPQRQP